MLRDGEALTGEASGDGIGQPRHVLAAQGRERRDRAGVGRRVAVALLDLGRCDDDLVAERRDRALGFTADEPPRPLERLRRLHRQRRLALVADEHEHIGHGRGEHRLERVDPLPLV